MGNSKKGNSFIFSFIWLAFHLSPRVLEAACVGLSLSFAQFLMHLQTSGPSLEAAGRNGQEVFPFFVRKRTGLLLRCALCAGSLSRSPCNDPADKNL
jgi:glyoxylate utilization-related uncharacterized protein